jgi:hypothetical protein
MEGYKAASGNYITGKELEQRQRQQKKERQLILKQREEEKKRQELIRTALYLQERREAKEAEEKQKQIGQIKDNILLTLEKNNPFKYNQYLIIWDVLTNNFYQIENDKKRGRINREDIKKAIEYIESFNCELLDDYWKEFLLA